MQVTIEDENDTRSKLKSIQDIESKFEDKVKKLKREISFYENNDNCPTCDQVIDEEHKCNHIDNGKNKIAEIDDALEKLEVELRKNNERLNDIFQVNKHINTILEKVTDENNQVSSLNRYIRKLNEDVKTETEQGGDLKEENKKI